MPFAFPLPDGQKRLGDVVKEEKKSTEVQRWADKAMFQAEPIDVAAGPKVHLLWMTPDPLGAIAAACKMYRGEVVRDLYSITDAERIEYLAQVQKTKLQAPFEFVQFHFLIEGVTRALTHQMVRQRTATYAQESLRFAVLGEEDGIPVALPPSLSGLPEDHAHRIWWDGTVQQIGEMYQALVDNGVPAEDARGLLPQNTLTRLHYTTDLRALLDHAGNRLCTQAQFEWRIVFSHIVEAIRNMDPGENGDPLQIRFCNGRKSAWMAARLTDMFRPVCYQTGKCEFKANFDRACKIRDRVDLNEKFSRPSSEWDKDWKHQEDHFVPQVGKTLTFDYLDIAAIKPGEWLLDPGAAREK